MAEKPPRRRASRRRNKPKPKSQRNSRDDQVPDIGGRLIENDYVQPGVRRRHVREADDLAEGE